nr:hypothetical protein [Tanacetum cinerariifolium]
MVVLVVTVVRVARADGVVVVVRGVAAGGEVVATEAVVAVAARGVVVVRWCYYGGSSGVTIQDGRVTVQQVQGRQIQSYTGIRDRGIATTSKENYAGGQPRVVKCYNCQGEGHMARQYTQPKRPRNAA